MGGQPARCGQPMGSLVLHGAAAGDWLTTKSTWELLPTGHALLEACTAACTYTDKVAAARVARTNERHVAIRCVHAFSALTHSVG